MVKVFGSIQLIGPLGNEEIIFGCIELVFIARRRVVILNENEKIVLLSSANDIP